MKGIVFTEFMDMVEDQFSPEVVDRIIENSNLASGGAYTAVGTYDHHEMIELVNQLSQETKLSPAELQKAFGKYLFGRFVAGYPNFFENVDSTFAFLENVETYIHIEVKKLYPDAELPSFEYEKPGPDQLVMIYRSSRPFGDLAEGLIQGCASHFKETVHINREDLSKNGNYCVKFFLNKE